MYNQAYAFNRNAVSHNGTQQPTATTIATQHSNMTVSNNNLQSKLKRSWKKPSKNNFDTIASASTAGCWNQFAELLCYDWIISGSCQSGNMNKYDGQNPIIKHAKNGASHKNDKVCQNIMQIVFDDQLIRNILIGASLDQDGNKFNINNIKSNDNSLKLSTDIVVILHVGDDSTYNSQYSKLIDYSPNYLHWQNYFALFRKSS